MVVAVMVLVESTIRFEDVGVVVENPLSTVEMDGNPLAKLVVMLDLSLSVNLVVALSVNLSLSSRV